MRFPRIFSTAALGALLAAAPLLAQEAQISYDQQAHFNAVKSYKLAKVHATDPVVESRMAAAVDNFLQGFGWRQVDKNPDILVTAVQADNGQGYRDFYQALDGYDWHEPWAGGAFGESFQYPGQVAQNALVIDLYSPDRKLMWRAIAPESAENKEAKKGDQVEKTVTAIFKQFPPKSSGPLAPNQVPVKDSPSSKPLTGPS